MSEYKISGLPVVREDGTLVGIITNRDIRFETNNNLSKDQKEILIGPLYKFYEFSIKQRSKEAPEKIIKGDKWAARSLKNGLISVL